MKKNMKIVLALLLCLAAVFTFAGCKQDKGNTAKTIETKALDMSLEDAEKQIRDAGCIPAVVTVYDDTKDDGAVLSFGDFMKDAKDGDYITVAVNDLSIKSNIESQTLAPRMIEKSSYEKNIYEKLDDSAKKKMDSFYSLKTTKDASEKERDSLNKTYPMTKNMDVYVLDTGASAKDLETIAGYISKTGYSAEQLFEDYKTVGIVPLPTEKLICDVLTKDNASITEKGNGIAIISYSGDAENVAIPSEIDGKPVTEISSSAFASSTLHAVTAGDNLEIIADKAFPNAYGLTSVKLGNKVKFIGSDAFRAAILTKADDSGFVTIDDDIVVGYTGDAEEITVPDGIRFIAANAFTDNTKMTKLTLPEGLLSIGVNAFKGCSNLSDFNIPNTTLMICNGAFYQNRLITSIVIPDSVTDIGTDAFFECNAVAEIKLGANVKRIEDGAFNYCMETTELAIPSSVEYIGNNAFYKCLKLASITGGENVSFLGSCAFEESEWYSKLGASSGEFIMFGNHVLLKYTGKDAEVTIPSDVLSISDAFKTNSKITKVTINDGCKSIASDAFAETGKLTEITIPASVTDIRAKAFDSGNTSLVFKCEAGSAAEKFAKDNHYKLETK